VFACPSDKGDDDASKLTGLAINNCFAAYGNSYLVQFAGDWFGIAEVTAPAAGSPAIAWAGTSTPIKETTIALKPVTKILMGDWMWHPNRDVTTQQGMWHNYKGKRFVNLLFGDGHTQATSLDSANPFANWW
jgi:prepilin-type processing-associated H-X9-DG protein